MTFMIDNNMGLPLARAMQALGEDVIHLRDLFPENVEDVDWLPVVGQRGIIAITRDHRLRHNRLEPEMIRTHRVGIFYIGGKNRSSCDLIEQLVRCWRRIKQLSRTPAPFAYRVPPNGTKIEAISIDRL